MAEASLERNYVIWLRYKSKFSFVFQGLRAQWVLYFIYLKLTTLRKALLFKALKWCLVYYG